MENKKPKPAKGSLLISEPFMMDPNFQRTIVLLTEHNKNGSIGFVLNKTAGLFLNDVMPDFPAFNAPLYYGAAVIQKKQSAHNHDENQRPPQI